MTPLNRSIILYRGMQAGIYWGRGQKGQWSLLVVCPLFCLEMGREFTRQTTIALYSGWKLQLWARNWLPPLVDQIDYIWKIDRLRVVRDLFEESNFREVIGR